jgi:hypothetical protein
MFVMKIKILDTKRNLLLAQQVPVTQSYCLFRLRFPLCCFYYNRNLSETLYEFFDGGIL